jgi:hypothetical protein
MAQSSELERLRERKQALVDLADAQRALVVLEWTQLRARVRSVGRRQGWTSKLVPVAGAAAAGLGFLGASRLGFVARYLTRGLAAWQLYRQVRGVWDAIAKPGAANTTPVNLDKAPRAAERDA